MRYDVIVIGGGHNGLITAALLARHGLKTLVVERRPTVGGAAITEEIAPGFRCSTLAHMACLAPTIREELRLSDHGLETIACDPMVFVPCADGRSLTISRDDRATAASIERFSAADARRFPQFRAALADVSSFLREIMTTVPPDVEQSARRDLWALLKLGRRFRKLGKQPGYRLLRWPTMPAADFVGEWFESEPLRAVIAAPAIFGAPVGPRSPGSTAVLLYHHAVEAASCWQARGGAGAVTDALAAAAKSAGAQIRTCADTHRIDVQAGHAKGVILSSGERLEADAIVSNADPQRTLLGMVDPVHLEPAFLERLRSYRCRGTMAKINLALRELPAFRALAGSNDGKLLAGRIHIGPDLNYLERAFDAFKYGEWSPRPYLDVTIPSITDPQLVPAGGHVMSICAQFAPYRLRDANWAEAGPAFADAVVDTLADYAPDIRSLIVHRQVITPSDLEATYSLTGGHIFHGELALDQLFVARPLLGWARYRTPIRRLYLCGSGTHPGYGLSGLSGFNAAREILKDLK